MASQFVEQFLDNNVEAVCQTIELLVRTRGQEAFRTLINEQEEPWLTHVCRGRPPRPVSDETRLIVLQLLLANGAEPERPDKKGWTPLLLALGSGFWELAKALLDAGADPHGTVTLDKGVKLLLDRGIDVDVKRGDGVSALLLSVCVNACDCAELLVHAGANVQAGNKDGHTPLLAACYEANVRTFELLIGAGANARMQHMGNHRRYTPLMALCDSSRSEWATPDRMHVARRLLAMGVPIDHQGIDGASALALASFHGFTDVVKLLLEQGASVSLVSYECRGKHPYGVCALQFAAQAGHTEVVRLLLFAGADPDHRDAEETTPVIAATRNSKWDIADLLIAAGAQLQHRNHRSESAATYLQRRRGGSGTEEARGPARPVPRAQADQQQQPQGEQGQVSYTFTAGSLNTRFNSS